MRILVFGRSGQVGDALAGLNGPGVAVTALSRVEADLADPEVVAAAIERHPADLVVNAAAYTAVDRAEDEPGLAFAVNRDGPLFLARACARAGRPLVHISTDYVFDGSKPMPYDEADAPCPLNVYGASKLAGEMAVAGTLDRHVILRTSWVFASHGANFVKTMLRLGTQRPELAIVADQVGCPTPATDIARAVLRVAMAVRDGSARWGTFHFTGREATTWFGFAQAIFTEAERRTGAPAPRLRPISTAEYPVRARRPANSRLDCSHIGLAYGIAPADWRAGLAAAMDVLCPERVAAS